MHIVLVSSLYLCTFWPFNSVLQNAKYRHLPTLSLLNSYPQLKASGYTGGQSEQSCFWGGSPRATLLLLHGPFSSPAPTNIEGTFASARTD